MPSRNPVEQLLAHYPLEDAALIFRILYPLLSDQGRAYLPALEAKVASRKSCFPSPTPPCTDSLPGPANARLSTSTWSSGRSGRSLASPLYDRSGSQMGFSDASSIAESAHSGFALDTDSLSTTTSLTAGSAGSRKGQRPGGRIAKSRTSVVSAASSPVISPRKPSFECPFCWELKIPTSISRKADLKRHFKQFHQNNAQWICQERGCSMAYDWKSAFEAHLKEAHGNTQHPSDSHQVKLCPQVVFACGFSNCRLIFEATSDDDAEKKAQEYFNHVANHFDDNLTHRNWSHSVRIRNLMRQTAVEAHWKDRKKGPADPVWQPHTSSVVRKILETRHFTDIALLVQWVVNLGSFAFSQPHSPIPKLPAELRLPVKENCTLPIAGHLPLVRRESHRHHMDYAVDHPMPTTKSEPNPSPEPLKTEDPDPPPEPEPEPAEPDYHHHPPTTTTATHHENSLSMLGFDHHPEPASFFTDHLPHHHHHPFDATPNTNTIPATTAPGSTDTFLPDSSSNNNNPISHWLGMTEPPPLQGHGMPLQPHLDAILGYSTGGFAGHDAQQQQQQQMVGGLGGFHHDGMGQQQQQQGMGGMAGIAGLHQHHGLGGGVGTVAMGDLEMGDCPY